MSHLPFQRTAVCSERRANGQALLPFQRFHAFTCLRMALPFQRGSLEPPEDRGKGRAGIRLVTSLPDGTLASRRDDRSSHVTYERYRFSALSKTRRRYVRN